MSLLSNLFKKKKGVRLEDEKDIEKQGKKGEKKGMWSSLKGHAVLMWKLHPYLWPRGKHAIRFRVILALLFLIAGKIINVLAPFAYKQAVDSLSVAATVFPYMAIIYYALGKFASSAFGDLRDSIFVKVQNEALKSAAIQTFSHLHSLSISYHLQRKTGTVLMGIDRGTRGISFLTSFLLFNILPIILEVLLVTIVLVVKYVPWMSMITLGIVIIYIVFTVLVTEWRTKFRKDMNDQENEAKDKAVDSLLNFETVKYFSAERHEIQRYSYSLDKYSKANEKSQFSLAFLNVGQSAIISIGQFAVMMLTAWEVGKGSMTVGDFVLVNTYILQVYAPLNFLGTSYRMIKQSLIDIESMFDILRETPEVKDIEHPKECTIENGEVEFEDVHFQYKGKDDVLKGVSFKVPAGKQLAIVGPSGAGKSTITKLLFRLYEPRQGKVKIDGVDISELAQEDLRRKVGIVPQDTVLFNDTIRYNIQYGNLAASEQQVAEAANVAKILQFIEKLPEGWNTKVGERGLKLSGGEKQRVSIARAVLKDPVVLVCDEATSSLDSITEREIQDNLRDTFKGKTTTIVLAHRLSTIVDSDEIIVLKDGKIAERGTHEQLLQLNGEYKTLWDKQSKIHGGKTRSSSIGSNLNNSGTPLSSKSEVKIEVFTPTSAATSPAQSSSNSN